MRETLLGERLVTVFIRAEPTKASYMLAFASMQLWGRQEQDEQQ
jgi:hypothetical protein